MKLPTSTVSEMNLKVDLNTVGLTNEQIAALKNRLAKAKITIASDNAKRQIRFDASSADIDNSIAAAVKLEQSEANYDVKATSNSGAAKTEIAMSSKGDANYNSCFVTLLVILGFAAFLVIVVLANKR